MLSALPELVSEKEINIRLLKVPFYVFHRKIFSVSEIWKKRERERRKGENLTFTPIGQDQQRNETSGVLPEGALRLCRKVLKIDLSSLPVVRLFN